MIIEDQLIQAKQFLHCGDRLSMFISILFFGVLLFFWYKLAALECLQAKRIAKDKLDENLAKKHKVHKFLGILERMDPNTELSIFPTDPELDPSHIFPNFGDKEVQKHDDKELNEGSDELNSFFLFKFINFFY